MWIQEKFKNNKFFSRKGIIEQVSIPNVKSIENMKVDIKVNAKKVTLDIIEGKNALLISDEVGFNGTVTYDILFLENAFLMVLKKGTIFVKDSNGKIYSYNAKNKLDIFEGEIKSICWKSYKDLKDYCLSIVKGRYNTDGYRITEDYLNNMIVRVNSYFYPHDNNLFSFKVTDLDTSLACGKFVFEKKEKAAYVDRGYVDYEEDLLKRNKKEKSSKRYSDMNNYDSDDDIPDYDEEESSLHEIEVYDEYSSEDSENY